MLDDLLEFRETDRPWHLPILAGLCMGVPIMTGYYTDHIPEGKLASLAALVILYIQSNNLAKRMVTLMTCCFGIMFSYAVGALCSFSSYIAPLALGLYAFAVHLSLYYLNMTRPPGNFFFIMIASVAICMPFNPAAIPGSIGFVGMGTMVACCLGLLYSMLTLKREKLTEQPVVDKPKNRHVNLLESVIFGLFVGLSLLLAKLLKLENPYWVPTSCVAVMQGVSAKHVLTRSAQRVLGTFVGLGVAWCLLSTLPSLLMICTGIVVLQIVVEFLVVRNYAIAVVFVTVMTMFLAETNTALTGHTNELFLSRFVDILTGSALGGIGGWVLYNERVRYYSVRQIRKTRWAWGRRGK